MAAGSCRAAGVLTPGAAGGLECLYEISWRTVWRGLRIFRSTGEQAWWVLMNSQENTGPGSLGLSMGPRRKAAFLDQPAPPLLRKNR